ncbi:MAG TPA: hypothetical protein ENK06_10075 [Gammaproteobacteria bacterium]|nr:hypothetical protein [Gammaproteobacteria bacterium]
MAADKALRDEIQAEIAHLLEKYGRNYNFGDLYRKHKDQVAHTTFYRWVKQIDDSGIPAQKAIRKAKKRVARKAKKRGITDKPALVAEVATEVVEVLPAIPDASDIAGVSLTDMSHKLGWCMSELENIIEFTKRKDGGIRNPKMQMQAIEGLRRTIDSTTRLMEMLWDIRRTEQFHRAIFNRLSERDPELVELILADLTQLNADWGIQL